MKLTGKPAQYDCNNPATRLHDMHKRIVMRHKPRFNPVLAAFNAAGREYGRMEPASDLPWSKCVQPYRDKIYIWLNHSTVRVAKTTTVFEVAS